MNYETFSYNNIRHIIYISYHGIVCLRRELKASQHKSYPTAARMTNWSLLSVLLCVTSGAKMTPQSST